MDKIFKNVMNIYEVEIYVYKDDIVFDKNDYF